MVCLIKSKYQQELQEYAKIVGSEEAAYYLLAMNNGYTLNYTPDGRNSNLYYSLLAMNNGSVKDAVLAKSLIFSPEFIEKYGDFIQNPKEYKGKLDAKGEPALRDLYDGELPIDKDSLSKIFEDFGKLQQSIDILENNNIFDRKYAIEEHITFLRNNFVDSQLQEYLHRNPDVSLQEILKKKLELKEKWDSDKIKQILQQQQEKLAESFKLHKVIRDDGSFYYETDPNDRSVVKHLRVYFVNSLREGEWKDKDGKIHKGVFVESNGRNAATDLIYISLMDGDYSTFSHELAHYYLRMFWYSDIVQKSLRAMDTNILSLLTPIKQSERNDKLYNYVYNERVEKLEEKLVNYITNRVLNTEEEKTFVQHFWKQFEDTVKSVITGFGLNGRQNILDTITSYYAINNDIEYNRAEKIYYDKYGPIAFQNLSIDKINQYTKDAKTYLLQMIRVKINSLKAESTRDSAEIARLEYEYEKLKERENDDQQYVKDVFMSFLQNASRQLDYTSGKLAEIKLLGVQYLDPKEFFKLKTDIISYYDRILSNSHILNFRQLSIVQSDENIDQYIKEIRQKIGTIRDIYDIILNEYTDNIVDTYAEEYVDVGDKEIFKTNAKLWLSNRITRDGWLKFESLIGPAHLSHSPIVRIVEYMTNEANYEVYQKTLEKGHYLVKLFEKLSPKYGLTKTDFFKMFIEVDPETGEYTGNFVREYNYGAMFNRIEAAKADLIIKFNERQENSILVNADTGELTFATADIKKEFYDKFDIEREKYANQRFTAEYYIKQREILSEETILEKDRIQRQINIILQNVRDKNDRPQYHKLTARDRNRLDSLQREKENLYSFYNITYKPNGEINSISKKEGVQLKMAVELNNWREFLRDNIKYKKNSDAFQEDLQKLIDQYGERSREVSLFKWYNQALQIDPRFYKKKAEIYGNIDDAELKRLYTRKSNIINSVKTKRGYYVPDLGKLNAEAWRELQELDEEISIRWSEIGEDGEYNEREVISEKEYVNRYINGNITNQPYYQYLKSTVSEDEFYSKYHYTTANGDLYPLTAFFYERPLEKLEDEKGEFYTVSLYPINTYQEIDIEESQFVNKDFISGTGESIQPKEQFKNPQWDKIKSGKLREFYDALLDTMNEANKVIPNNIVTRKYRMPQMLERTANFLFRNIRGNFFSSIKQGFTLTNRDTLYNEEVTLRPDGTPVTTIPLRWIRKLEDPSKISTDIIGSVVAYYEMALNFKLKSQILPIVENIALRTEGGLGNNKQTAQSKRIRNYVEMYIQGKMRKGISASDDGKMSDTEKTVNKVADVVAHKTHLKLMAHNLRTIMKNLVDSVRQSIVEISAGKYFNREDMFFATRECMHEFFNIAGYNVKNGKAAVLGQSNVVSKVAGAMQANGISGKIYEIFKDKDETWFRRVVEKNFAMGEYTLVDYTIKGWIVPAIYHNFRLIDNFDYRKVSIDDRDYYMNQKEAARYNVLDQWESSTQYRKEYMNQQQAQFMYLNHGKTLKEGDDAWNSQSATLWDAFDINENGDFKLKQEYLDKVRPYSITQGRRVKKAEIRVRGVVRDRLSVIAGMLDDANKSSVSQNILGLALLQMRGWLVTFFWDCFHGGHDFDSYKSLSEVNPDSVSGKYTLSEKNVDLYDEIFNFETGQSSKGWLNNQHKLWYQMFKNMYLKMYNMIKPTSTAISNYKPLSNTQKWQRNKMMSYMIMALMLMLATQFTGRLVEDDPDNILYNMLYSVNVASIQESVSQLSPITVFDLVKNITVQQNFFDDLDYFASIPAIAWQLFVNPLIHQQEGTTVSNEGLVKNGTYDGISKKARDGLKISSYVVPELGIDNIFKNFWVPAHKTYQNWQLQQFPNSILTGNLVYKPDRRKNKKKNKNKSSYESSYVDFSNEIAY